MATFERQRLYDHRERVTFTERVWLSDDSYYIREADHRRVTGGQSSHLFSESILSNLTPWERFPGELEAGRTASTHRVYSPRTVHGEYVISRLEKEDFRGDWSAVEEELVDYRIACALGTTRNKRRFKEG